MHFNIIPKCLKSQESTLIALLSILAGLTLGVLLRYFCDLSSGQILWIALPGELFMRMLTCLSMPLVLPKLVAATGSMDPESGGKILGKVLLFYGIVNLIIETTGIFIFYGINSFSSLEEEGENLVLSENALTPSLFLRDLLFNMVPDNIVTAPFQRYQTKVEENNGTIAYTADKADNNNILGLVVAATAVGMILARIGDSGKPLLQFCSSLSLVTSSMMEIVIKWVCPPGLFSLIASQILLLQDPVKSLQDLTLFVITVVTGWDSLLKSNDINIFSIIRQPCSSPACPSPNLCYFHPIKPSKVLLQFGRSPCDDVRHLFLYLHISSHPSLPH